MACRTFTLGQVLADYDEHQGKAPELAEIANSRRSPAMVACFSDRGIYAHDEKVYREHNITHTDVVNMSNGGRAKRQPNPSHKQCQCGNCASHIKRAARTGVAEPGREL